MRKKVQAAAAKSSKQAVQCTVAGSKEQSRGSIDVIGTLTDEGDSEEQLKKLGCKELDEEQRSPGDTCRRDHRDHQSSGHGAGGEANVIKQSRYKEKLMAIEVTAEALETKLEVERTKIGKDQLTAERLK